VTASTWAASLADEISYWSADAIVFQELCYGQLSALRNHLGAGWGYVWWSQWKQNSGCSRWGSDLRFGMAIVAKHAGGGALPSRQAATLPKTADCTDVNKRGLLCAKPLIDGKSVLTCVTHFSHKAVCSASRGLQAQQVADLTLSWSEGGASIVAGDLNAHPDDPVLDSLYQVDGSGRYVEADQEQASWWPSGCTGACRSGEPTYPAVDPKVKIDYILFSAAHFGSVSGDAVDSDGSMSDHRLLRAAAVRR
jgi:endonuclease/exonuclease/phosphatase family metal-dependent hydrolase